MTKEAYVFVVCGSKEHIDTLHFSLNYLKSYFQEMNHQSIMTMLLILKLRNT